MGEDGPENDLVIPFLVLKKSPGLNDTFLDLEERKLPTSLP